MNNCDFDPDAPRPNPLVVIVSVGILFFLAASGFAFVIGYVAK